MSGPTNIEWTEWRWNPIVGCSLESPGCAHCYAMKEAWRYGSNPRTPQYRGLTTKVNGHPVWTGEVRLVESKIEEPLRWRTPRTVFVNSMSDLFHPSVPAEWIATVYGVMVAAVHLHGHTMQVLTKRAARMRALLADDGFWDHVNAEATAHVMERVDPLARRSDDARATLDDYDASHPPPGIWLGVSAEDQKRADERLPDLRDTPAAVHFVSAEPLLGPLDLTPHLRWLDWVIVGGESGPRARPMHPDWAYTLRDQCAAAFRPFFFKQWGEWAPSLDGKPIYGARDAYFWPMLDDGTYPSQVSYLIGKKRAGRLLDGRTHDAMPARAAAHVRRSPEGEGG